jgi:SET domain-containing protein
LRSPIARAPRIEFHLPLHVTESMRHNSRMQSRGFHFLVRKSRINGRGLHTLSDLPPRRKIGELSGARVKNRIAWKQVAQQEKIFLVALDGQFSLDISEGNSFKDMNHSCQPNCYLRIIAGRIEVYTLHRIAAGTELTVDYEETPHPYGMPCSCKAPNCRGVI